MVRGRGQPQIFLSCDLVANRRTHRGTKEQIENKPRTNGENQNLYWLQLLNFKRANRKCALTFNSSTSTPTCAKDQETTHPSLSQLFRSRYNVLRIVLQCVLHKTGTAGGNDVLRFVTNAMVQHVILATSRLKKTISI